MENLEIINPLLGGIFIGLAATGLLWANGRIMGISGILGGLLNTKNTDQPWRVSFLLGLILGSFLIPSFGFSVMETPFPRGLMAAAIGGLLVGLGTSLGNGCTSGHGVCGISRFSMRSIAATITFILSGIVSVFVFNTFFGGL